MAAVKSLCQRAVWLDGGRITLDGRVDDVVDAYLHAGRPQDESGLIPDDAPRTGSGEARVKHVELLNGAGGAVSQLYLGDPFTVALTFDVQQPLRDVVIAVGISSFDGVRITSSYSTDGGQAPLSFCPGRHRIALDLEIVMLPRRYTLDVAIARTDGYEIDYVQQALDFTALDVAREGPDAYKWSTVHGYVRPSGRWQLPERRPM
jgi:lipopolysaccharide transport system ATP-binding protein